MDNTKIISEMNKFHQCSILHLQLKLCVRLKRACNMRPTELGTVYQFAYLHEL